MPTLSLRGLDDAHAYLHHADAMLGANDVLSGQREGRAWPELNRFRVQAKRAG